MNDNQSENNLSLRDRLRGIGRWATLGIAALTLTACVGAGATDVANTSTSSATSTTTAGSATTSSTGASATESASGDAPQEETQANADNASVVVQDATDLTTVDTHFDDDDLTWDAAEEQTITLTDGASSSDSSGVTVDGDTVTITAGGVYRVSGSLTDGQLVVTAADDETVTVILDVASITNADGTGLAITSADEVTLFLADGTDNAVTDGSGYEVADDATPVAAIASKSDLTIAGGGSLTVTGNTNDGINTADGLVIAAGNLTVTSADDGIRGKDYVSILDGTVTVKAGDDGIKSDNVDDADRGWLLIEGGTVTIDSGDDALKAEQALHVADGIVTVASSVEGLESANIIVSGGTLSVNASDDGINATKAETSSDSTDTTTDDTATQGRGGMGGGGEFDDGSSLAISGGTVTIDADFDGLDSNGSISLTGGDITVSSAANGGDGPVDANGDVTFEGAKLVANGTQITSVDQIATKMGGGMGGGQTGGFGGGPGPRG